MRYIQLLFILSLISSVIWAKEYHVSKNGNNNNSGTYEAPLFTIQAAANLALPGDIITVHEGIYREHVSPPRGGSGDNNRIVYRAAENESVEIRGSELIRGWEKLAGNVWRVILPNNFFGEYNPYKDVIMGDWFNPLGRIHHTGEVYLNGKSLWESALLAYVINPPKQEIRLGGPPSPSYWYAESDKENTFIYADFGEADPNREEVEINVRKTCFYPDSTGINYITVSGFIMKHAATQWAPPTAEQQGLIGTNWSKGWIIENNRISDSRCSGITLGKHGDEFDNTSENSAEGYVETIHRAVKRGWSKENIGSHIVRNNIISHCEQTGICGSLGGVFSVIENNVITDIWTKRQFTGAEMGGVKIHASIDMIIRNNRFENCGRGLWLDWMAQGTRVTGNIFLRNTTDDIFVEVNHGPFLIDNNILLSKLSVRDWSEGGAYVHNLFAGNFEFKPQGRFTPYHLPHSTELAGLLQTRCGDNRFYNNIFMNGMHEKDFQITGIRAYSKTELPVFVDGNVYLNGVEPFPGEKNFLEAENHMEIQISDDKTSAIMYLNIPESVKKVKTLPIHTENLGKALVPGQPFENPDGSPLQIDTDYFGQKRNRKKPVAGPFENPEQGKFNLLPESKKWKPAF